MFIMNREGIPAARATKASSAPNVGAICTIPVKECVDVEKYKEYQGRWVKNAYDPQFTEDGKYDEKAAAAAESLDIYICMMMKAANKAFHHALFGCGRPDEPTVQRIVEHRFVSTPAVRIIVYMLFYLERLVGGFHHHTDIDIE